MSTDDLSRQIKWLRKHNAAKSTPSASDALSSLPSLSPSLALLAPPPAPALSPADSPSEADGDHAAKDRGPSWLLQVFCRSSCRSSCARGHLLGRIYWRRRDCPRAHGARACGQYTCLTANVLTQASQVLQKHADQHQLYLTTPSGAALQPGCCLCIRPTFPCMCASVSGKPRSNRPCAEAGNEAAVMRMKQLVNTAYNTEESVVAAKTEAARKRMERRLHAQLSVMAKNIMLKLSQTSDPKITPNMMIYLEKALGGNKVAELCNQLMLPCPITSVGNSHLADVLAGFSKASSLVSQRDSGTWGGSSRTEWQKLEGSWQGGSSGPPQGQAEPGGQGEAGGAEGEGGWMNTGGKWVWVSSAPPGYRAVTVPHLPPQATPLSGPLSAPPRPAASGGRTGEMLGQDLSGRALSVLELAASAHPSPAHRRREGAHARTDASEGDDGRSSSGGAQGGAGASRPGPPWQAAQEAQGGEHRGGDRGRWQARGRSTGGGERLGDSQGQGKGETYAQQLLAGEVQRFETKSREAIATASRAAALRRRRAARHPSNPPSPPLPDSVMTTVGGPDKWKGERHAPFHLIPPPAASAPPPPAPPAAAGTSEAGATGGEVGGAKAAQWSPPANAYVLALPHSDNLAAARGLGKDVLHLSTQELNEEDADKARILGARHGFESNRFAAFSAACCRTIVLPLYATTGQGGAGFPALNPATVDAQRVRNFVANGNVLVVAGGTMGREFLNRFFSFQMHEADGGYSRGPWLLQVPHLSGTSQSRDLAVFRAGPARVEQGVDGNVAVPIKSITLPPDSTVLYGDGTSATVVHIPYCERLTSSGRPQGETPGSCHGAAKQQGQCSCGHIIFLSRAFRHAAASASASTPWEQVLRASVQYGAPRRTVREWDQRQERRSAKLMPLEARTDATQRQERHSAKPAARAHGEGGNSETQGSKSESQASNSETQGTRSLPGGGGGYDERARRQEASTPAARDAQQLQHLASAFVGSASASGWRHQTLAADLSNLERVVGQLQSATAAERAARGPLKHRLQRVDSMRKLEAVRRLQAAARLQRRSSRPRPPVIAPKSVSCIDAASHAYCLSRKSDPET